MQESHANPENHPWQSVSGPLLPYGRQSVSEDDIEEVASVLRSDWITQGPTVDQFENTVANVCGAQHAVAVSSGTAALHIAALALDLKPGDSLWTSPITFVATANCARLCGADVDFVDIDPRTHNISVDALTKKLERAEREGSLPAAVAPVHFAGQSCAMREIKSLADKFGFRLLEDASHAVGAAYLHQPVGNCAFSDLATLSFHPVKIFTTGEGGIVLTNDGALREQLLRSRTHGITQDENLFTAPSHGPWFYEQIALGLNYRITDFQCALGLSQAKRLPEFIANRRRLARRYDDLLAGLPLTTPFQQPDTNSSWHLYVIRLHLNEISKTRRQVFEELRASGVGVQVHYIPVHLQPYYRALGFAKGDFPAAENYYEEALTLPLFAGLHESDQDRVVAILRRILDR